MVDGCTSKAPQRVNTYPCSMDCEHGAYSGPTRVLRAPFVSHTFHACFVLYGATEVNTQSPNEHSGDSPSILAKLTTGTQCMRVT